MAKKTKSVEVGEKRASLPGKDHDALMDTVGRLFDEDTRKDLSSFLKGDVKVRGRTKKKKTEIIDLTQRTRIDNPAFSVVEQTYGVYNPESISVDTFDLMKKDPQISAGLAFVKLPIFALPWRVECENQDIERFVEFALKRIWRRLIRSSLTAVEYGFASHEKVFTVENVKVTSRAKSGGKSTHFKGRALLYDKIKPHHPGSIEILINKYDDVIGLRQTSVKGNVVKLDKNKMFLFTHDEEFGNPFGKSRLVAAYKYWYWKELLYQFMLMYFERRGSPPVIATAPLGSSTDKSGNRKQNLDVALDLAASLLSNSVAVLPYQADKNTNENMWALNYLLDDKRGEMFIQAINHIDVAILRALWLPESTISEGSNYGQTSVHADLFLMSEKGLVTELENAINLQLIPILVQANFRPKDVCDCIVEMESLDFNRKIALKEMFIEIMRNIDNMVQIGMRPKVFPDIEKMAKILQVPISTLDEEVDIQEMPQETNEIGPNDVSNKKPTATVIPIDGGKSRAVPRRAKRESFTGTREVDRKVIRPGSSRADQMRGKMSEDEIKKLEFEYREYGGIEDIYQPQPDENGEVPVSEKVRAELMKMAMDEFGLKEIKKALMRLRIWSQNDIISNFELMSDFDMIRALNMLPDFYVDILSEAMSRKLSEKGM